MSEKEKTSEDIEQEMDTGRKQSDVYSEEGLEKLEDNDEISPTEQGFMEGEQDQGSKGVCATCGKALAGESENVVEKEIDGKKVFYCSDSCASKG